MPFTSLIVFTGIYSIDVITHEMKYCITITVPTIVRSLASWIDVVQLLESSNCSLRDRLVCADRTVPDALVIKHEVQCNMQCNYFSGTI